MDAKTALLAERQRIIKELADLDSVLASRFGWTADKKAEPLSAPPAAPEREEAKPFALDSVKTPARRRTPPTDAGRAESIAYAREADEWLETVSGQFSVVQFREWLRAKYGDALNDASIKGPFRALERSGKLKIVTPGAGRRPTVYTKPNQ